MKEEVGAAAHGPDIDDIAELVDVRRQRLKEVAQVVAALCHVRLLDDESQRVLFCIILHQSALRVCSRPKTSEACRDSNKTAKKTLTYNHLR